MPDLALLVLRVWFGGMLLMNHGWAKGSAYSQMVAALCRSVRHRSASKPGAFCLRRDRLSSLIAAGLFTRFAAVVCIINMTTAFVADTALP